MEVAAKTPRRRVLAYVVLALVLIAGASVGGFCAFKGSTSHTLQLPPGSDPKASVGVVMQKVPPHTPYVYVIGPVCVKSGSAQITKITTVNQKGSFQVLDWAVQTPANLQPPEVDGVPGTAAGMPGYNHDPVTSRCDTRLGLTQVAVTVEITSTAAATQGLKIHYKSDGDSGSLIEKFTITECTTAKCPHLAYNAPKGDT